MLELPSLNPWLQEGFSFLQETCSLQCIFPAPGPGVVRPGPTGSRGFFLPVAGLLVFVQMRWGQQKLLSAVQTNRMWWTVWKRPVDPLLVSLLMVSAWKRHSPSGCCEKRADVRGDQVWGFYVLSLLFPLLFFSVFSLPPLWKQQGTFRKAFSHLSGRASCCARSRKRLQVWCLDQCRNFILQ